MSRIILDMDSILANILDDWLAKYNAAHGDNLTIDDIKQWEMHHFAKAGKAIYKVLEEPGFIRNLKPIDGAIEAASTLTKRGHQVKVVSAAAFPVNYKEKVEWMAEHFPFLKKPMMLEDKHEIYADVLVDDAPHNAKAYKEAHPNAWTMTIGYPYNIDSPHYDYVCGTWRDTRSAWAELLGRIERVS